MNHIRRLQAELHHTRTALAAKEEALQEFRIHLSGEKFIGTEFDGSRKDWIAVADVLRWLIHIAEVNVPAEAAEAEVS